MPALPAPLPACLQPRTFRSLFTEYQGRVDACWDSQAILACKGLADALYRALADAPIKDTRRSVAGEQSRIMARALAMRELLQQQDPTLAAPQAPAPPLASAPSATPPAEAAVPGTSAPAPPPTAPSASPPPQQPPNAPGQPPPAQGPASTSATASPPPGEAPSSHHHNHSNGQGQQGQQGEAQHPAVRLTRSSNEEEPDATAEQCMLSVCLTLAALFEQSPFTEGELRRRLYDDFTQLKRNFRDDELLVLHGRTGTIAELFSAIKDLDKRSGLQNLIGILFEDWVVHSRVDPLILADKIVVEVRGGAVGRGRAGQGGGGGRAGRGAAKRQGAPHASGCPRSC